MLEEEAVEVVRQFDLLVDYREAVLFVMSYVRQNRHLLCCACDSMGRDEMKRFFCTDFIDITRKTINDAEQRLGVRVEDEFREFLAHFYTEAAAGLLIDEFRDKKGHDPEKAADYFTRVLENSMPSVLGSVQ